MLPEPTATRYVTPLRGGRSLPGLTEAGVRERSEGTVFTDLGTYAELERLLAVLVTAVAP